MHKSVWFHIKVSWVDYRVKKSIIIRMMQLFVSMLYDCLQWNQYKWLSLYMYTICPKKKKKKEKKVCLLHAYRIFWEFKSSPNMELDGPQGQE